MLDQYLTPKQVAGKMQVHLATVHRWIATGKLRAYRRVGGRLLVREADLEGLIVPVYVASEPGTVLGTDKEEEYRAACLAVGSVPKERPRTR